MPLPLSSSLNLKFEANEDVSTSFYVGIRSSRQPAPNTHEQLQTSSHMMMGIRGMDGYGYGLLDII